MAQAVPQARSRKEQIPPDLVVKLKSLILLKLFYDHSDAQMWFKRRGAQVLMV